jgi:hypothetical protein
MLSPEPILMKSRSDKVDPNLAMPYTLTALPKRMKERREIVDPRWTKSSTLIEDPRRTRP